MARRSLSAWPGFPTDTCTICVTMRAIASAGGTTRKHSPSAVAIGERRRPDPSGRPGYLRVDTVHQGDTEKAKGVYHINAVDEVTQWEITAAVERISEAYLEPVVAMMLAQFPFVIHGFHADNGSEFINQTVARLLTKLMMQQIKAPGYSSSRWVGSPLPWWVAFSPA